MLKRRPYGVCVQPQMIVDLAHMPNLTQRRADAPLNTLSESPVTDDAVHVQMMTSTDDHAPLPAAAAAAQTSNHQPTGDQPVQENAEDVEPPPEWNVTGADDSPPPDDAVAAAEDEATTDKAVSSSQTKPSAAASHNLPKLIIPDPDDRSSPRQRR